MLLSILNVPLKRDCSNGALVTQGKKQKWMKDVVTAFLMPHPDITNFHCSLYHFLNTLHTLSGTYLK